MNLFRDKVVSLEMKVFKHISWMLSLLVLGISCSHKYDSNTLDLSFYQWNQWADREANWNEQTNHFEAGDLSDIPTSPPSCGWEALHRGNGNLVRIPTSLEDFIGVSWYHCRFTLPENWEEKEIQLFFENIGPVTGVYLNEELIGFRTGGKESFELDVTDRIYYTRDNHLAIRITDPEGGGGIGGNILVKAGL